MEFAAGEKRSYLTDLGIRFMPTVGWAERGDLRAEGHGNSVPRFHIAWGTGTGVVEPFVDSALQSAKDKLVTFYHRHRVDELVITDGVATGIKGTVLAPDDAERATPSNRDEVGEFELSAQAVIITTGGIGGNHDMVRRYWPDRMGTPPASMITGVDDHRRARLCRWPDARHRQRQRGTPGQPRPDVALHRRRQQLGPHLAQARHPHHPRPVVDVVRRTGGAGYRPPYLPGYDTLGTLRHLRTTAEIAKYDHSWFILNQKIIKKEFALSGSEQNPDITGKSHKAVLQERFLNKDATGPVEAFKRHGADFVVANSLEELVEKMNGLTDEPLLDPAAIRRQTKRGICRSPTHSARTFKFRGSAMRDAPLATGSAASRRHTASSTPRRGR